MPAFVLAAAVLLPGFVRAQTVKPWSPPADSFKTWATEAGTRFRAASGDSATGPNLRPYELVGAISRRLLRSLGPANLVQAPAIRPALDSLGFATDVLVDPELPNFVLVMVRNPHRHTAEAIGYLYWYKERDLRMQGVLFKGGHEPVMRAWWTGKPQYPYEWAVVDKHIGTETLDFTLFRLSAAGTEWRIQQDETRGGLLGEPGAAGWTDVNNDGMPEVVTWTRGETDSFIVECRDCPKLITERVFTEGPEGFEMLDARLLPSPYATLVLFARFLRDDKASSAARLLSDPAKVKDAVAAGLGTAKGKGAWSVEYGETGVPWPHWLAVRVARASGAKRYIFHFTQQDGHWLIHDWIEPKTAGPGARVAVPISPPVKAPAGKKPGR